MLNQQYDFESEGQMSCIGYVQEFAQGAFANSTSFCQFHQSFAKQCRLLTEQGDHRVALDSCNQLETSIPDFLLTNIFAELAKVNISRLQNMTHSYQSIMAASIGVILLAIYGFFRALDSKSQEISTRGHYQNLVKDSTSLNWI